MPRTLAPWLTLCLILSFSGFLAGFGEQAPAAFVLSVLWIVLLVGAPFVLCWPVFMVLLARAISDCAAAHPGFSNGCLP
jgi:hypothetical protein